MPKVNGKKVFAAAKKNNFILAACNFRHPNGMEGVARAARELEAPYIIELARSELGYCGFSFMHNSGVHPYLGTLITCWTTLPGQLLHVV